MKIFSIFLLLCPFLVFAQETNDPAATVILDKISKKLKSSEKLKIEFEFTMQFPEQEDEIFPGVLIQEGNKFRTTLATQEIISNGKDIYIILKEQKTAQLNSINDADMGSEGFVNPKDMLTMYSNGDYIYGVTGEEMYNNERIVMIEFKPIDRYSEYSKIRMGVSKKDSEARYLTLFGKDASRFTMTLKSMDLNPKIEDKMFTYNQDDYPGIVLEDLRID